MAHRMRAWPCLHMARRVLERPQRMDKSTADASSAVAQTVAERLLMNGRRSDASNEAG